MALRVRGVSQPKYKLRSIRSGRFAVRDAVLAGTPGPQGEPGAPGAPGAPGVGVPAGGVATNILMKASSLDYATLWYDLFNNNTGWTGQHEFVTAPDVGLGFGVKMYSTSGHSGTVLVVGNEDEGDRLTVTQSGNLSTWGSISSATMVLSPVGVFETLQVGPGGESAVSYLYVSHAGGGGPAVLRNGETGGITVRNTADDTDILTLTDAGWLSAVKLFGDGAGITNLPGAAPEALPVGVFVGGQTFTSPLNVRPVGGTGTTDLVLSTDGVTVTLRNKSTGGLRVRNALNDTTVLALDNSGNVTMASNATLNVPYIVQNGNLRFVTGQFQFTGNSSSFVGPGLASFSGDLTVMGSPIRMRSNSNASDVATFTPGTGTVLQGGASSVVAAVRAALGQTGNLTEWQSLNGGTVYSTVSENGHFTTRKTAAPADAELVNSEAAWWLDDTGGAPQVVFKGKDASGTVRSIKLPLGGFADGPMVADADGATVTFDIGKSNHHSVTLGGNRTLAVSNDSDNQSFVLFLTQDGTGSRTVTWWAGIRWQGGAAPTLSTAAGKTDVVSFFRLAAGSYLGTYSLGY